MKTDLNYLLRSKMINEKLSALEDVLALLRGDMLAVLENYMKLTCDINITADIDERSGDIIFGFGVRAKDVYDCGKILKV